jgi:hypothetical protein
MFGQTSASRYTKFPFRGHTGLPNTRPQVAVFASEGNGHAGAFALCPLSRCGSHGSSFLCVQARRRSYFVRHLQRSRKEAPEHSRTHARTAASQGSCDWPANASPN